MLRRISIAAAVLAVAGGGLVMGSAGPALAGKPVFTAGAGSHVNCTFTSKVKLSPKLLEDYNANPGDPDPVVAAIPNTTFSSLGPVTTTSKGKTVACTGNFKDPTTGILYPALGAKITASNVGTNLGPATCTALLATTLGPPTFFPVDISWKASGAKINPSHAVTKLTGGATFGASGTSVGFTLDAGPAVPGTSSTGSFAGGVSHSEALVDGGFLAAVLGIANPTSANPAPPGVCNTSLIIKNAGTPKEKVKVKKGKGLNKFSIGAGINVAGLPTGDSSFLDVTG